MMTNTFKGLVKISSLNKLFKGIRWKNTHSKVSCLIPELELSFNKQINTEFFASFTYLAMFIQTTIKNNRSPLRMFTAGKVNETSGKDVSFTFPAVNILSADKSITTSQLGKAAFYGRQSVSLAGCQKYFMNQALDEREHAQKLIDYLNQRGSTVVLQDIKAPTNQAWDSPLSAFKEALELEKTVSQKLFELHQFSEKCGDQCACSLLENDYLDNQVEECDKLSRLIAQLETIGSDGLGIYLFDKYLLKENR